MMGSMGRLVALFGGSFNPPHVGHVLAVSYVKSIFAVDSLLVVPVYRHAFGKDLASFDDRLEMCRLAMGWLEGTEICDIERSLGGESRTLFTIEALKEREPDARLRLVIGADVLPDLPKWHRFDRIAELAPPIILGRAGFSHPDAPPAVLPEISSTAIRAQVRAGELDALELLVPATVRDYIRSRGLYQP
jgi:nicotinate-nucleotide adenylyltransferase